METSTSGEYFQNEGPWNDGSRKGGIQVVLLGAMVFFCVVFTLGLIVNLPAAIIYIRSRQLRGLMDKFILFILITDVLTLLTFLPVSFVTVFQVKANLNFVTVPVNVKTEEERPIFSDSSILKDSEVPFHTSVEDQELSSHCVQQWVFQVHRFLLILTANLAVLGALKIAVERYLAVVAPLHYHKILKSSLILALSLTSFFMSIAFAVLGIVDPLVFPRHLKVSHCAPQFWKRYSAWTLFGLGSSKEANSISLGFNKKQSVFGEFKDNHVVASASGSGGGATFSKSEMETGESLNSELWLWPVLKLVHASVFFIVPVCAMIFMYLRIWSEARRQNARMGHHRRDRHHHQNNNNSSFILPTEVKKTGGMSSIEGLQQIFTKFKLVQRIKRKAKMDRAARVALLTIGLSTLCYGTLYFVQTVTAISFLTASNKFDFLGGGRENVWSVLLHLLPTMLASLHPLLSPLVYVYRYKRVRSELKVLLNSLISCLCFFPVRCFCCCNHDTEQSSTRECEQVVHQFNSLAKKLPLASDDRAASQEMYESQATPLSASSSGSDITIQIDLKCSTENDAEAEENSCDVIAGSESSESDMESQVHMVRSNLEISSQSNQNQNGLFQLLNCWMSSYSKRWSQHRESVTSTASFITLLSTRRKSIPSGDMI